MLKVSEAVVYRQLRAIRTPPPDRNYIAVAPRSHNIYNNSNTVFSAFSDFATGAAGAAIGVLGSVQSTGL